MVKWRSFTGLSALYNALRAINSTLLSSFTPTF